MVATPDAAPSPAVNGDRYDERLVLFEKHLHLVPVVAQRLLLNLPSFVDVDDVVSSARIGLWHATEKYNPALDSTFETYARVRMRGHIFDEIRAIDPVARSVRTKQKNIVNASKELGQKLGRDPLPDEIAKHLGVTVEDLEKQNFDLHTTVSLDAEVDGGDADTAPFHQAIADERCVHPADLMQENNDIEFVQEALEDLDDKKRVVLNLYFWQKMRLKEIASFFGLTESRVSQILEDALKALRDSVLARIDAQQQQQ